MKGLGELVFLSLTLPLLDSLFSPTNTTATTSLLIPPPATVLLFVIGIAIG